MRYQGKLVEWNDAKGFGFVQPNAGGIKFFVHMNDFANTQRRPAINDLITFEMGRDKSGRNCAINVVLVPTPQQRVQREQQVQQRAAAQSSAHYLSAFWLLLLCIATVAKQLPWQFTIAVVVLSVITYSAYSGDKQAAESGRRRTPENTLHLLALIGGWPGAAIAQQRLRHKTAKQSFRSVYWLTVFANCAFVIWLFTSDTGRGLIGALAAA
jgi:uncharacterized membrane protein YsdA (DUF1294 family)/cold shock CspA family protein